jgi:glycosyltransferase involved in cell wall biosynthesis
VRIGFFNSSLPQPGRKPGGVDKHLHRLANVLQDAGHEVTFYTYSEAPADARYAVVQLAPSRFATSMLARTTLVPLRLNLLDTSDLDVLHLHGDDWFFLRRRLPTVRTFYGSALYEARKATRLRRRVSQYVTFALELLSSRLATSTYSLIPEEGVPYRTRGYLPCGVGAAPQEAPADEETPSILFVGTWNGRKRGRLLHETFVREVRRRRPGAELVMVSDHCEPADGVRWRPSPSDEELRELYLRASVFCLPSSYEGFGIPYIEAMATDTPVVATDNPGARFVLDDGAAGLIVRDDELGDSLAGLLGDPARRSELARAGRKRVQEFAWPRIVQAHESAYREAISQFRR